MNDNFIKKNINLEIIKPYNNLNKNINNNFFDNKINYNDFYLSKLSYFKLFIKEFLENNNIYDYLKNFIKFLIFIFIFFIFLNYYFTKENI
jgi:hypothetical protein